MTHVLTPRLQISQSLRPEPAARLKETLHLRAEVVAIRAAKEEAAIQKQGTVTRLKKLLPLVR